MGRAGTGPSTRWRRYREREGKSSEHIRRGQQVSVENIAALEIRRLTGIFGPVVTAITLTPADPLNFGNHTPEPFRTFDAITDAEREILSHYLDGTKLKVIPKKRSRKNIVLAWLVERFAFGVDYTENQVNELLKEAHPDYATLRRGRSKPEANRCARPQAASCDLSGVLARDSGSCARN